MTSTSVITGTGFMKCIPMTCFGLLTNFANFVIEIELVFEAKIAFFGKISSNFSKIPFLTSKFSVTAYKKRLIFSPNITKYLNHKLAFVHIL